MTEKDLISKINSLIVSECVNYQDGNCLPKDNPCQWREGSDYPLSDKGIICPWAEEGVLPLDSDLYQYYQAYMAKGLANQLSKAPCNKEKKTVEPPSVITGHCDRCGQSYVKRSNRQRYCDGCKAVAKKIKTRDRVREWRNDVSQDS